MNDGPIVISYRRADSAGWAGRLADDLTDVFGPERVFRDMESLLAGQDFLTAIRAAIGRSEAVVVVVGPSWAGDGGRERLGQPDDVVRAEVREALSQGKTVVPVLVGGAGVPPREALPEDLHGLLRLNFVELSDSRWSYDVNRLLDGLGGAGISSKPVEAFPEVPGSARAERRDAWLTSGLPEAVRPALVERLRASGLRLVSDAGEVTEFRNGSKLRARILGGFFVSETTLPVVLRLRITPRGPRTLVEALLQEDFGPGLFTGMEPRYESVFSDLLELLRSASAT